MRWGVVVVVRWMLVCPIRGELETKETFNEIHSFLYVLGNISCMEVVYGKGFVIVLNVTLYKHIYIYKLQQIHVMP